ncbi:hypothetical protein M0657_011705 [Pyricularia oryzae]|nr:hypothetical protein M0657_011705 [Pyricularia oryzae]
MLVVRRSCALGAYSFATNVFCLALASSLRQYYAGKMLPARSGCRLLLFLLQNHQKWRCGTRLVRGAK